MWDQLLGQVAGGSSGGGGTYGNSGSSGVSTPINTTAGGGFGTQTFNFGSQAFAPRAINPWLIAGALAVAAYLLLGRRR